MTKKRVGIRLPRQAQKVSVADKYAFELEALGSIAEIVEIPAETAAEFAAGARDMDAVITSWGLNIDREIIAGLSKCQVIGIGSVGVDMVDIEAATEAGIVVTNVPDVFVEEVADHAMMLLLSLARRTPQMAEMARKGQWYEAQHDLTSVPRLYGQTLGLFAFGNVARRTAHRAQAFGMRVIAYDPYVSEMEITGAGVEPVNFGELLARSDYLSIHSPDNAETRHIFNAETLSQLKAGAVLINTARGPIVDEAALIEALRSGAIAGAALDVLEVEPPSLDNPLLNMANVLVVPHVGSATTRMRPETRRRVGREVSLVLRGKWPMSCVNPTVLPRLQLERWQPYPMSRGPNR